MSGGDKRAVNVSNGVRPSAKAERRERACPCDLHRVGELLDQRSWFIIRVRPGEEFAVVDRLADRRLFAFSPTRSEWRFKNRMSRRKVECVYAAAPGYVVVAQDRQHRMRRWAAVMACPGVLDVLGMGMVGVPVEVSTDDVRAVAALSSEADDIERFMPTGDEFREGYEVMISRGPLRGFTGEAVEIMEARTRIILEMLGAARSVIVETRTLERVA